MTPLSAQCTLDLYFLEARSKLLDIAAMMDRLSRGANAESLAEDPKMVRIRQALEVLLGGSADRAEQIQQLFSLPYDPTWARPSPRV